jgi:eukaryotic-like serine/threonine-protein kinase
LTPGTSVGPYRLVAPIGAGGMGEVYRATDTRLNRDVALKIVPDALASDPDRVSRFRREAQVLAALNHPNVAGIYGLEEMTPSGTDQPAVRALVMEFVDGPTLADRLAQGPPSLDETISIARQIAEAIEYAHEQGIIHRDLKPANIKIAPSGTVKVLDFGLAKAIAQERERPNGQGSSPGRPGEFAASALHTFSSPAMTQRGVILGTAAYMSPEQAKGKPADRRADIWSLGIVLFEMVAGRPAFDGETISETMAHVITKEPDWSALPPTTPRALEGLLRRCLVKDPRNRLQAIGEARIVLSTLAAGSADSLADTAQAPSVESADRHRDRGIAWLALASIAVLSLGAAGWFAWRATTAQPPAAGVRPVHFSVSQPGLTTTDDVAISSDGTAIAFRGLDPAGPRIWIRSLESATATPLPGSEGGQLPFWSPDGTEVGFVNGSDLMAVHRGSGLRRTLASGLSTTRDSIITWTGDGAVFVSGSSPALLRVSAAGTITPLGDSPEIRHASLLPNRTHILFTTGKAEANADGIAVAPLDNLNDRRMLIDVPSRALYASGHLLYVRNSTLMAHAFDLSRLELAGDPYPVTDDVRYFRPIGRAMFWAAADTIAYRVNDPDVDPTLRDRAGAVVGSFAQSGTVSGVALSPDGTRAIFQIEDRRTGTGDLHLYDLVRRTSTRLTNDQAWEGRMRWARDGRRIAYASDRQGGAPDVYVQDLASGAEARAVVSKPGVQSPGGWLDDGRLVIADVTEQHLMVATPDRSTLDAMQPALPFVSPNLAISPDQRWIAYSGGETPGRRAEVFAQPLGRPGPRVRVSIAGGVAPVWAANGKELFFRVIRDVMVSTVTPGDPPSFSPPRVLFSLDRPIAEMDVMPDAQRFLIVPAAPPDFAPLRVLVNWRK